MAWTRSALTSVGRASSTESSQSSKDATSSEQAVDPLADDGLHALTASKRSGVSWVGDRSGGTELARRRGVSEGRLSAWSTNVFFTTNTVSSNPGVHFGSTCGSSPAAVSCTIATFWEAIRPTRWLLLGATGQEEG